MYKNALFVALGGAIGTLLRYSIDLSFPNSSTLIVNLVGSFLLGLFTAYTIEKTIPEWLKVGIGVGLLGGFTTMSTFASDVHALASNDAWLTSVGYSFVSVAGGLLLALVGYRLIHRGERV
ncbi:fluoride efflux transporter FluC [Alkalibacillus almallahensis]|uniref:fluoride efflux transporter FluC n=1 Tax=Alkalibacillus almallahensis TaxID=1379154 RepID=UPI0014230070|nr:CrcB family protein [Alkalibacillus almallahensis]NIK11685.1 CrcB protein [Alkalibacillus almallahensis]